jgi:predicted nucleic acid-binding protein
VPPFAVDTSCLIAAVCDWHEHHQRVAAALERRLSAGARMTVPAPALVEMYAVLTRLPPPRRMAPKDAWTAIDENFALHAGPMLEGEAYVALLRSLASLGIAGGRAYDAVIAACARKAGADELLTLNARHFDQLSGRIVAVDPTA